MFCGVVVIFCVQAIFGCCFTVFEVGSTLLTTLSATQGVRITGNCLTPRSASAAFSMPLLLGSLCASELMQSSKTTWKDNQPEDVPYGRFGPDLIHSLCAPCLPTLS